MFSKPKLLETAGLLGASARAFSLVLGGQSPILFALTPLRKLCSLAYNEVQNYLLLP